MEAGNCQEWLGKVGSSFTDDVELQVAASVDNKPDTTETPYHGPLELDAAHKGQLTANPTVSVTHQTQGFDSAETEGFADNEQDWAMPDNRGNVAVTRIHDVGDGVKQFKVDIIWGLQANDGRQ